MADLARFHAAQRGSYDQALAELTAGRKRTHWMWYIFPQLAGLGQSAMAQRYAITNLDEARAYLADATLGARYLACTRALLAHGGQSAEMIMGEIDAMKLRSSLTLFDRAGAPLDVGEALATFFGSPDPRTLALLGD